MTSRPEPRWEPIEYAHWWDFPRVFVVRDGGRVLVLESVFEDALDDYGPFRVYELHADGPGAPDGLGGWLKIKRDPARQVGEVPERLGWSMFRPRLKCRFVRLDMILDALEHPEDGDGSGRPPAGPGAASA
jgi:hypothetical protein